MKVWGSSFRVLLKVVWGFKWFRVAASLFCGMILGAFSSGATTFLEVEALCLSGKLQDGSSQFFDRLAS